MESNTYARQILKNLASHKMRISGFSKLPAEEGFFVVVYLLRVVVLVGRFVYLFLLVPAPSIDATLMRNIMINFTIIFPFLLLTKQNEEQKCQ